MWEESEDVYKRQDCHCSDWRLHCDPEYLPYLHPVSYTHLKQFSKMLQTECFYYVSGTAILTLTIGTLTGFVLCKVFNQVGTFGTLTYHFPVLEISIYFVALFFILAAYSVFSVRYSKRHPVIERIKTME